MKRISSILGILLLLVLAGCSVDSNDFSRDLVRGSGKATTEQRQVSGITGVELTTVGTLTIEQNGEESLIVEGDDNILPLIETTVSNNKLTIGLKKSASISTNKPLKYSLTVKRLNYIGNTSSGRVEATGLSSDDITTEATSSGAILIDGISARTCNVKLSSSGSVTLSGSVDRQEVTLSSSGSYKGEDLASKEATVTVSSSGSATVRVSDMLNASLSSSGSVRYIGNPRTSTRDNGSGEIKQISE